ncbi:unnamed protein product [Plutella xylostella]|uniref:(diamondback moth) hypothetical protein n=1 Tax=Plutella xylostella TaxID=51655 RepID=A0A8S4G934_PLUXY|nr:unnamed protein product [Plutella xylostella]
MTMVLAIKDDENKFDMLVRTAWRTTASARPSSWWTSTAASCAQDHEQVPEDQELRPVRLRRVLRLLPGVQVPRLDECALPVRDPGVPLQLPGAQVRRARRGLRRAAAGGPSLGAGEYGAPNSPHAEYGPPPQSVHSEYGPPPAFPDPRHPADATGSFSEKRDDAVPPRRRRRRPAARAASSPAPRATDGRASGTCRRRRRRPPRRLQHRQAKDERTARWPRWRGRPRSVEDLPARLQGAQAAAARRAGDDRRQHEPHHPGGGAGDVNFALNNAAGNETVVIQSPGADPETICMSVPSVRGGAGDAAAGAGRGVAGAAFLCVRVRHLDRKQGLAPAYFDADYVKHGN